MFSCHKLTQKIEEVVTQMHIDKNKVIHSKAPYDEDKIYMQARNIFEANTKFKKFFDKLNSIQDEKEKTETENSQLQD
jgi:hypothetical protein